MTTTVAIVMPVFNEEAGVTEFLDEIVGAMAGLDLSLIVADDCSTDHTRAVLQDLGGRLPLTLLPGPRNMGHGPTTLRALHAGLGLGTDVVVAVDGDGQFTGNDIRDLVDLLLMSDADVIEGVRHGRGDPLFRRATSWTTRTLVHARSHVRPVDANTPLRVYRPRTLERLLAVVPADAMTPNLLISSLSRSWGLTILEIPVASIPRRGGDPAGSTWRARRKSLPSKRYMEFCVRAGRQWVALPSDRSGPSADPTD
jgi:glycosyltransferase involved in cell wall biosynthesis